MVQHLLLSSNTDVIFRFLQFQACLQVKSTPTGEGKRKGYQYWGLLKKIEERASSCLNQEGPLTQEQWIDMMLSLVYQILRSYDNEQYYWPILSQNAVFR